MSPARMWSSARATDLRCSSGDGVMANVPTVNSSGLGRRRQGVEDVGVVGPAQGLEPPHAVGETQHPVVERDPRVRLRDGALRRRRQLLDEVAELVAPRADPAPTEHPALRDGRQVDASKGCPSRTRTGSKAISASPWCQSPMSATTRSRPRKRRRTSTGSSPMSRRIRRTSVARPVVNDLRSQLARQQLLGSPSASTTGSSGCASASWSSVGRGRVSFIASRTVSGELTPLAVALGAAG